MSYRNILVQIDETPASNTRARAAAHVAAHFGASLTAMFLSTDHVPAFLAGDSFTAAVTIEAYVAERDKTLAITRAKARAIFEAEIAGHNLNANWIDVNGDDDAAVFAAARRFDLTIFPHVATSAQAPFEITAAHIGMGSGGPVLVLPDSGFPIPFGKRVMVAWKETREAARALRDAWPFLSAAEEVHFLAVSRDAPAEFDDVMRSNLEAHGVKAVHMHVDRNEDVPVGNAIQRHAGMVGADLVVLGLYGHSRMRELFLGGVSRDVLGSTPLPLLVSH